MIGERLSHYEIIEKLGEGGMGAVYLARDPQLDRRVALKILSEEFAADAERLARFHREARALAALSHPHVAAIHGMESAEGLHFLVMEHVDGADLSVILGDGPLASDRALDVARQIAEGLEAAHEKGIVHRDLKPANVMVTPDGDVKILDFGLARALREEEDAVSDLHHSPTLTAAMTAPGIILGTASYMSPEQARGQTADRRSDIWAFGALLYEMLAGTRAFPGDTVSDTLAAVLRGEPDWDALPEGTPACVVHLLHRCLVRDRRQRLQDIGEARILLSGGDGLLGFDSDASDAAAPARRRLRMTVAAVACVAAGALLAWFVVGPLRPASPNPSRRYEVAIPGTGDDQASEPRISPNGRDIVYVLSGRLWLRRLDLGTTRELPGTDGARHPFWSPDSRQIGFFQKDHTMRLEIDGGAPIIVCDHAADQRGAGGAWTADGRILFSLADGDGVLSVSARGGVPATFVPHRHGRRAGLPHPLLPAGRRRDPRRGPPEGRHVLAHRAGEGRQAPPGLRRRRRYGGLTGLEHERPCPVPARRGEPRRLGGPVRPGRRPADRGALPGRRATAPGPAYRTTARWFAPRWRARAGGTWNAATARGTSGAHTATWTNTRRSSPSPRPGTGPSSCFPTAAATGCG